MSATTKNKHFLQLADTCAANRAQEARDATRLFLPPLPTHPVPKREPSPPCGHSHGTLQRKASQCVVSCAHCLRFVYNAPKREQLRWWGRTS